jgi:flagellar FliJ protein
MRGNMTRTTRLQPIAKINKQEERNAARIHGETMQQAEQQQKQLSELIAYRNQYLKGFQSAVKSGLAAVQMQDYRLFIQRLDEAIAQQQQCVTNGQQKCASSREQWADKRNRSKMINKVVEKSERSEQQASERREQRELEDRPHKNSTIR